MKKILYTVLVFMFMPLFANAQLEMHFGKLQDEDWYVEENFTLVEATIKEWKKGKYAHKLGSCGVVVNWTFFIRVAKPELLDKFAQETINRSMASVKEYAKKCVNVVDSVADKENDSREVYDVIVENLAKTGLIEAEDTRLLTNE